MPSSNPPPPRPSSPSSGTAGTTKKSGAAKSPRPSLPATRNRIQRQSPRQTSEEKKAPYGMTRSTSNSSIRSIRSNSGNIKYFPPSLDMPDDASMGNPSSPLPTPTNNNAKSYIFGESTAGSRPAPYQSDNNTADNTIQPDPQNPDHRRNLPRPNPPPKCPLFCVFYAEFDIVVGPKVCFQSPKKFMHFDVDVGNEEVHNALDETFQAVLRVGDNDNNEQRDNSQHVDGKDDPAANQGEQPDSGEYWNWTPTRKKKIINSDFSDISSQITLPSSGYKDDRQSNTAGSASGTEGSTEAKSTGDSKESLSAQGKHQRKKSGASITALLADESTNNATNTTAQMTGHSRNPSFASSKGATSNQPTHEGDNSTIDTELMQNSIFAATSEYIITGNELANQTITVSTHGMHILSRPMIISDTQRYERNSFLFAVGFVLRRNVDPRPYWPVLSNLSTTLRYMEVEDKFLSDHRTRPQIQIILEDILVSLNSKQRDCHLLLNDANLLNLHLFRPPPPPTPPVPDYAVPILLRPEWSLQMFDWDLTINWIVPHIDGIKYVKQIAASSEVDLEMVRACLRVLRHHNTLSYVDVFRYSNIYECTHMAMELLTGEMTDEKKKLVDAAFWYSAKAKYFRRAEMVMHRSTTSNDRNSPNSASSNLALGRHHQQVNMLHGLDLSLHRYSTPWSMAIASEKASSRHKHIEDTPSLPRSFPSRTERITIREDQSIDDDVSPSNKNHVEATGNQQSGATSSQLKEVETMKKALAQLFSSCNRNQTFGDLLVAKISSEKDSSPSVELVNERIVDKNFLDAALSPLRETPDSETGVGFEKTSNQRNGSDQNKVGNEIDWKRVFDYFDHRRLITFGVVRGLIRRVHQYPLALVGTENDATDSGNEHESNSTHGVNSDDTDEFDLPPEPFHMAWAEAAAATTRNAMDDRSMATSYSASPLLQGIHPNSRGGFNKISQKKVHQRSKRLMLERIASAFDGTRSDDELSCMFDAPIEKLIEMIEDGGRWNVISVFSS